MNFKRTLQITFLILAAEAIYALPFVLVRIFRPTFLSAFEITNKNIGVCYTLYGITATLSYFFGGLIADKFELKNIMAIALLLTGLGGLVWVYHPSLQTLYFLYVYWGFTTIMLFWSPLIKATRIWGGKGKQMFAFALFEGGRGLVAAIIGSIGVYVISSATNNESNAPEILQQAVNKVFLITSILIILIGCGFFLLPRFGDKTTINPNASFRKNIFRALKYPVVWILMIVVLTSYIGYRIADVFTQYAVEVYGYSTDESGLLGTFYSYLRPVVCLLVLLFANKTNPAKWLTIGFSIMVFGGLLFVFDIHFLNFSLLFPLIPSIVGAYILRILYFTVLEQAKIPITITGTVIGIISMVGFSPDIFLGYVEGYYLDEVGGAMGYQYIFIFFLASSLIGLVASIVFNKALQTKRRKLST